MPVASQQQIQVLHVDDEPDFADLTTTFLEREDDRFAVETAHSANDGLEIINDRPPDCVVSDYNMPGMDGLEFLEAVREEYPDLPFILFTGKGSEEVASDAISAGATDYLQKQSGTEQYNLLTNRIQNVVDQYRSEQRLRETRKEYTAVFENAQNALILVTVEDDGFRYQQCNPRAVELIGRKKTEIVGNTPGEALGPENGRKVVGAYRTCIEQGNPVEYTLTLELPMGQVIREGEVTPVATNGEIEQLVVEFQDITQQRQRQQELKEYGTIIEALTDAVYVLDEEGRFTYVNDEFVKLVGYDRETILGNSPSLIKDAGAVEQAEHQLGRLLSSDGPDTVSFEVTIQPRDGDPIVCADHMGVLPYEGDQFDGSVGTLRDITDGKERERQLAQTRNLMANMEQLADVGAWEYDAGTETLVMTGGACRIHGLDPDADPALAEAFSSFHTDNQELLRERFDTCLETGEPYEIEVRLTTPGGEQRWVTARGERVTDGASGNVVRGYIQEITEQTERQRKLERRNDLFEKAQKMADIGAWAHDIERGTLSWTDQVYDMHGVSEDFEPSLDDVEALYHPEDQPKLHEAHAQAVTAGEPYDLEVRMTARDDGRRWIRTVADPQVESGDVVRVRGTVHDITDRVEREQELRETTRQLQAVLDTVAAAVFIKDIDGRYQLMNEECRRLLGVDADEDIAGLTDHDLLPADVANQFQADDQRVMEAGETLEIEEEVPAPDETQVNRTLKSPFYDEAGELVGVCAVSTDITERKERERQVHQERNRLDGFASVVSHDLRSPLRVADGKLELAQTECDSPHLDDVADAIDRSQALIEDLLTLAREGEDVSEVEPVAFADVAESSWQTVESQSATLETHATQSLQADKSRLTQLFENLYRNAIEHGGDDVTVSVGTMDDGFYVADTGPGIPEDDREEIFEAGYSTNEEGTGFGLRIVRQVANAHGWEVAVTESEQGGARFEFTGVEFADQ